MDTPFVDTPVTPVVLLHFPLPECGYIRQNFGEVVGICFDTTTPTYKAKIWTNGIRPVCCLHVGQQKLQNFPSFMVQMAQKRTKHMPKINFLSSLNFLLFPRNKHEIVVSARKSRQQIGLKANKDMAPKLSSLPFFQAFWVIFCPDFCSYFCLVCGGGGHSHLWISEDRYARHRVRTAQIAGHASRHPLYVQSSQDRGQSR